MKESLYPIDKSIIFRETFNSQIDTERNGGTPTSVSYENGVATFEEATSTINYMKLNRLKQKKDFSYSIKFKTKINVLGNIIGDASIVENVLICINYNVYKLLM